MNKVDEEFIEQLGELWYRYRTFRFGRRVTFKGFMEWISSLHD